MNLQAVACRAERSFLGNWKIPATENSFSGILLPAHKSPTVDSDNAIQEKAKSLSGETKEINSRSSFVSVPLSSSDLNSKWGVLGKFCGLDRPCMVDEVHLRRFDGLLVTHQL